MGSKQIPSGSNPFNLPFADRHYSNFRDELMSPYRITFSLCLVEILCLIGIATFPALLPVFTKEWHLTNTEAGWISAVYYAGYMISVPLLVSVTDRLDARRIVLAGALGAAISAAGFAILAEGFWSAMLFRFLAGISLAGIYMPGLKLLGDHTEGSLQSRYVSFYTASFSIGLSLSYLLAGEINSLLNWHWAFGLSSVCAVGGLILALYTLPLGVTHPASGTAGFWFNFRPVLATGSAMAYIFCYAAHMWELFSLRSWIVAFLTYSENLQPLSEFKFSPTQLAFAIGIIGLPASIAGNELARKYGRKKTITLIMMTSALICAVIGFTPSLPYALVAALCILHGITVVGDSAALTAGAVAAAPAGYRGATLAMHSTFGFGAAFIGPLAVGMVLDFYSPSMSMAWGMAFVTMAVGCALGPVFLMVLDRNGPHKPKSR